MTIPRAGMCRCRSSSSRLCAPGACGPYVYDAGTLLLDLVDRRTNAVVWRGWAEGSLDAAIDEQDRLERNVDDAVAKILARLPRGDGR